MTVPPPPPPGADPGGFYGGRVTPPPPPLQSPSTFGGYPAAPGSFAAPAATFSRVAPAGTAVGTVPEPVTVACTLLGVFAAIGVFTLIVVLSLANGGGSGSSSSDGTSTSVTDLSLGLLYGVLWGGSGIINVAAIVYLRRGNAMARVVTTVICGLWAAYWLRYLVKLSGAHVDLLFGGSLVHLLELLLLGLAVASALPAVLLWRPSTRAYFG